MNILVRFESPHTLWAPLLVFEQFYKWFKTHYNNFNIIYENTNIEDRSNPSGTSSPHVMTIRNLDNNKYIIVSYWDRAIELTWVDNGWDTKNNVDIITSSGVHTDMDFTPFSYTCYNLEFEHLSKNKKISWKKKTNDSILFRGFLYGDRYQMWKYKPEFFSQNKVSIEEYFNEINRSKISLSLNGAGEICNRDIEILSCGTVLLRPKLTQRFYNDLIPNYHYVSVDKVDNPKEQLDILLEKYNEIKKNDDMLETISKNGFEWYTNNGTVDSNVNILKKIINIEKLI